MTAQSNLNSSGEGSGIINNGPGGDTTTTITTPWQKVITRLFIKNLCIRRMNRETLCETVRGITHIKWLKDKNTLEWYGSAFLEMATPEDATRAVEGLNGKVVFGREMKVAFAAPKEGNGGGDWPDRYTEKIG